MLPDSKQEKALNDIVNDVLKLLDEFDLTIFVLKPENIQDVFKKSIWALYLIRGTPMENISPDWIVEYVLEMVGYDGDKIKPNWSYGRSGPFVLQALKQIVKIKVEN